MTIHFDDLPCYQSQLTANHAADLAATVIDLIPDGFRHYATDAISAARSGAVNRTVAHYNRALEASIRLWDSAVARGGDTRAAAALRIAADACRLVYHPHASHHITTNIRENLARARAI